MPINVNNPEVYALTRKFAAMEGLSITEAILVAVNEAIERRAMQKRPARPLLGFGRSTVSP